MLPPAASARPDVDAVWIFGSYGTPAQTPLSDIDLGILPAPRTPPDVHWALACEAWLAEVLGTEDVDLTRVDTAPLWLQEEIVATGRLVFVRNEVRLADYLEALWRAWGDFLPDWRAFQAESRRALLEAFGDGR